MEGIRKMNIEQTVDSIWLNITPSITMQKPKAEGIIGNITIYFPNTFNWLQRKMWKMCFGLDISNIKE